MIPNNRKNLNRNLQICGLEKKDFMEKCSICDKYFRGKFELTEHHAIEHQGERWFCEQSGCKKRHKSINGFKSHILKYHQLGKETAKDCLKCFKSFYSQSDLMDHQRYAHDAPKLFCKICNSTFDFKGNYNRHQNTCSKEREKGKMLKCFACCKRFKRTKYLLDHINGQHKPPKYECKCCGKKFPYRSSLRFHMEKRHP